MELEAASPVIQRTSVLDLLFTQYTFQQWVASTATDHNHTHTLLILSVSLSLYMVSYDVHAMKTRVIPSILTLAYLQNRDYSPVSQLFFYS
jgi:hypothetical protein